MIFHKEILSDLVYEDIITLNEGDYDFKSPVTIKNIKKEITDTSRWSIMENQIFSLEDSDGLVRYFSTNYSYGATENQDESPYEYDDEWIECQEVEPRNVMVVQYVPVS